MRCANCGCEQRFHERSRGRCVIDGVECERYQQPDVKAKKKAYMKAYYQQPDVKAKMKAYHQQPDVKAKKKAYRQQPDVKAKIKAYMKAYHQQPDVKAKKKAYRQQPDVKAKMKAYYQQPDVKAKMKAYHQQPDVKAKMKAYYQQPDVKAKMKAYYQQPDVKAKKKAYRHKTDKKQTELTFTKQLIKSVEKNLWNLRNKFNRARQTSISNNRLADMAFVIDNEVEHLQNLKYQQESIEKQIAMIRHGQKLGSLTAPNIAISEPHIPSLDEGQTQS